MRTDERQIQVTNPHKMFFEEIGATKGDVVEYYQAVAEHMLRHAGGRMLVLERFPDGIHRPGFYQKNVPDYVPEWISTVSLPTERGQMTKYAVADSVSTIVYLANQAAVVFHALLSPHDAPRRPEEIVFDLDPATGNLGPVRRCSRMLRETLDDLGLAPRVKSSGQKGLHIHVLAGDGIGFDEARGFARAVARHVIEQAPDEFTMEHRKRNRGDRVFIDVLRNAPAAHAAMPYTLRATPEAACAIPLDWDEALDAKFHPRRITLRNVHRRLAQKNDPWAEAPEPSATVADAARVLAGRTTSSATSLRR